MKNLARHIELLLHDNDCVILPGFGGFIAHNVPAYYVSEDGLYYPPSRSISFNATITMNDGLLAQSYMRSYQVDYARATYMIDATIEKLIDILNEEGSVSLPRIGTLRQDINQSLQFTPHEAGISSPQHFGLGAFVIKELSQIKAAEHIQKAEPTITSSAKTISLHINKRTVHHILSTAAVFLLLLMIALPTGIQKPTDIASLISTQQKGAVLSPFQEENDQLNISASAFEIAEVAKEEIPEAELRTNTTTSIEEPIEAPTASTETSEAPIIEPEVIAPTTTTIEKTYHIIVASLPSNRGADETLNQYTRLGYNNVSLVERDNRVRISLMQFTDKAEANRQLTALRQQEKFQSAWLLAVHN